LIADEGLFMLELKHTRLEHRTDCAVHGVKDLPIDPHGAPALGAILARFCPLDALISRDGYMYNTRATHQAIALIVLSRGTT